MVASSWYYANDQLSKCAKYKMDGSPNEFLFIVVLYLPAVKSHDGIGQGNEEFKVNVFVPSIQCRHVYSFCALPQPQKKKTIYPVNNPELLCFAIPFWSVGLSRRETNIS